MTTFERYVCALFSNGHITEAELLADIQMFTEVDTSRSEWFRSAAMQGRRTPITAAKGFKATTIEQRYERLSSISTVQGTTIIRYYKRSINPKLWQRCHAATIANLVGTSLAIVRSHADL